jgi:hypothetical protein
VKIRVQGERFHRNLLGPNQEPLEVLDLQEAAGVSCHVEGVHEERFGFSNMRTLFATTSSERADNFAHAAEHAFADQAAPTRRGKVFLFASQSERSRENLLTYECRILSTTRE